MNLLHPLILAAACLSLIILKVIYFARHKDWAVIGLLPLIALIMTAYLLDAFTAYSIPQSTGRMMMLFLLIMLNLQVITRLIIQKLRHLK